MQRPIPFGDYILLERISVGGMAELFKAKPSDPSSKKDQLLVLKRILPHLAEDERFIQMFINEAGVTTQLRHPNVCTVYELGQHDDAHYIAMEYIAGKDLLAINQHARRSGNKLPLELIRHIGAMTARGLGYAHARRNTRGEKLGIVHRDISPENIQIGYDGSVKLIDFGIARAKGYTNLNQTAGLKGKCGYMSPEQVAQEPLDHRADIFALGTVLYETLTGDALFKADNEFLTLEKIREADVAAANTVNPEIPLDLNNALLKALARNPSDRFHDAAHLARILTPSAVGLKAQLATWMQSQFASDLFDDQLNNERWKGFVLGDDGDLVEIVGEDSTAIHEAAHMPVAAVLDPDDSHTMAHPPSGPFEVSLLGGRIDGTPPPLGFSEELSDAGRFTDPPESQPISLLDDIPEPPPDRTRELTTVTNDGLSPQKPDDGEHPFLTRQKMTIILTCLFSLLLGVVVASRVIPPSPVSHSGLVIKVVPRKALRLSLDGKPIAQTAPIVIRPLKPGPHVITVEHDDYMDYRNTVELSEGKFTSLDIFMEPRR